jgi:SnoaL-like domain
MDMPAVLHEENLMTTHELVRKLIDESEIRNLVARIAQLADLAPDLTEYYSLWTDDGVYDVREPVGWKPGDPSMSKKVSGHAEIKKDRDMLRATGFQGPNTDVWHLNTTLSVKVLDGDTAEATSYWMLVHGRGTANVMRVGHYHDTFRRSPAGWKLAYRIVTPNNGGPNPKG